MIDSQDGSIFAGRSTLFSAIRNDIIEALMDTEIIHTDRWQQLDISQSAAHGTHELLNVSIWYDMPEFADEAQRYMKPDLPWAEAHFQERVGGKPINPGVEHANWPHHAGEDQLHLKGGKYDHNYMERMWASKLQSEIGDKRTFHGYRFRVGDLGDVVEQLRRDPTTRQAFLPIWFPEDTGAIARQRVPCSLGYHFIIREGKLHMSYYLRSCEIYRHFTNDLYMAVRLAQWVRQKIEAGLSYLMGQLTVHIVSLHAFVGDTPKIWKELT